MMDTNKSALAGEFLVAGELSRRGYPVSITMGNAKAIDLFVETQEKTIKIDVKASQYKTSWPINNISEELCYVFVYLHKREKIRNNDIDRILTPPEYYIVSGQKVKQFVVQGKKFSEIPYKSLIEYKENWNILPKPKY